MDPNTSRSQSASSGSAWKDYYHVFGDDEYCNDMDRASINAHSKKKAKKSAPVPAAAAQSPTPLDDNTIQDLEVERDVDQIVPETEAPTDHQHILYLPLRPLLLILSYLSLADLEACAFTCREMLERITSESVWKDTFFHHFQRNHPTYLINLGLTWRSEYIERTNLIRNIARSSITSHSFDRSVTARPISRVIGFGEHTLAVGNSDSVILLDSIHGTQQQVARFAPPAMGKDERYLMDATDGVGWLPQFAVAFCSPTTGLLNLQLHTHPYLGNAPSEPIHNSVDVALSPPSNAAQPVSVAWFTASPIAHLLYPWPLCQTYSSPSSAIVAIAYSDTSIKLACASVNGNGKCVQVWVPPMSPAADSPARVIQRLCASTCAIVALLSDKDDPERQTLVSIPVPTSLYAHLVDHVIRTPLSKKWDRKLGHIGDRNRGDGVTKRSQPPIPTASDWDTSRTFDIPAQFGTIVQVVYSAHTHPLAILRTSNRKSSPLVLVRIDHPDAPMVAATIDLTCANLMTELPLGTSAGPMTAFSFTTGLGDHHLRPIPVYKHFPIYDLVGRVTRTSVLTTMVLAIGDAKGNVHVLRVQPPKTSPSGGMPCPADFDVDHFCTLVGRGGVAIRAVHVNAGVVVAADVNGAVKVWDPLSRTCLRRFKFVSDEGEAEQVTQICSWEEAPERIAFVLESGNVKVLDVMDAEDKIPKFCRPMVRDLGPETGNVCRGG